MPRKKGMIGPGAGAMGGVGRAPARPPTAMAGRGAGVPSAAPSPAGGMGIRPPGLGPSPGGQPVARSPAASIGGASGFNKGGEVEAHDKADKPAFNKGGAVGSGPPTKAPPKTAFAKGGVVGGSDAKARVGRDRGGAGKSC